MAFFCRMVCLAGFVGDREAARKKPDSGAEREQETQREQDVGPAVVEGLHGDSTSSGLIGSAPRCPGEGAIVFVGLIGHLAELLHDAVHLHDAGLGLVQHDPHHGAKFGLRGVNLLH